MSRRIAVLCAAALLLAAACNDLAGPSKQPGVPARETTTDTAWVTGPGTFGSGN